MNNISSIMKSIKEDPSEIERLIKAPGKQLGEFDGDLKVEVLSSGFTVLDNYKLLKRNRGELIIIGARPSQGKSGLGFQIATQVAERGKAHIFSLEMDHESIVARQASIALNRPLDMIQRRGIPSTELNAVKAQLGRLNCIIDDRSGLNIEQICSAAREQYRESKTDLIVIDYLQIIDCGSGTNRAIELGKVSAKLKELAKELRVPIIALSQLNRNSEYREGGEPMLSDLKESGSLEQDADVVLLINRTKDSPNTANIIIAKNRNGPTGEVRLQFASAQCRFIDSSYNPLD